MRAEIVGLPIRFRVEPIEREDGTTGPPYRVDLTVRSCWKRPPRRMDLVYLFESEDVAYYGVKE
jgi:hypothetical protein